MLVKGCYDTWQIRMLLHIEGKEHGEMLPDSIFSGPCEFKEITIPANEAIGRLVETRMQTLKDLTPEEKIRKECDIRAANIILHRLPNDIYTLLNHNTRSYDICYRVKKLMEGTELTKQERESKLANEFDRFTSKKGETIQLYYMSRFVTGVKQTRNLHEVSFDQLYAYLKQNEPDANESQYNPQVPIAAQEQPYIPQPAYEPPCVYQQPPAVSQQPPARPTSPDLEFIVPTFLPMLDPIASLNKDGRVVVQNVQGRQSQGYTGNAGRDRGTGTTGVVRTIGDLNANPSKVIKCYNYRGEGHNAKQCTAKKWVKYYEWFKENMLLAQQQEAGIKIDAKQQDFFIDGFEGFDSDCEDLQLNGTSI
ncbi:hypothetical protein Tco_1357112, partial [Tanacetum coccineum]